MYAPKHNTVPFFYTPAPNLAFDHRGNLSAMSDWRTVANARKPMLPKWPVPFAKLYPQNDFTNDYFLAYPSNHVPDINKMTDVTANWPTVAFQLK